MTIRKLQRHSSTPTYMKFFLLQFRKNFFLKKAISRRKKFSKLIVFFCFFPETAFVSQTQSSTEDLDEVDRLANHPVLRPSSSR